MSDPTERLGAYRAKRDPRATPEPGVSSGEDPVSAEEDLPRFVVQEHHARRLHWDLRLEPVSYTHLTLPTIYSV